MRGGKMLNNAGAVKRLLRRVLAWRPDRADPGAAGAIGLTADTDALRIETGIGLGRQPITVAMRLEVGPFFGRRPTEPCDLLSTMPGVPGS